MTKFVKSKREGDVAEKFLLEMLEKQKENGVLSCAVNNDKDTKYDFDVFASTARGLTTFEVKYDIYSERSGNIAIEFWNSKKNAPSGINVTKADYWVHILPNNGKMNAYITTVKTLKDFIKSTPACRTIFDGGDKNANIYLYKSQIILPIFSLLLSDTIIGYLK